MKKILSVSLIVVAFLTLKAERITFKDAMDKKLIAATIKQDNDKSTHYHSPFVANIKNESNKYLEIVLDNGFVLIPDNPEYQQFIVTQELLVKLKPFQSASKPVYAMCIRQSLSAPKEDITYSPFAMGDGNLLKLTKFVEKTRTFEPNAQFLLWEMIGSPKFAAEIDTFELYDTNQVRALGKDENGKRKPIFAHEQEYVEPELVVLIEGSFSMQFGFPRNVHIAMFNMQNVIVKELYNNPQTPVGKTVLGYNFNSLEFPDEEYKINLVVNGEVMMTRKVNMSAY